MNVPGEGNKYFDYLSIHQKPFVMSMLINGLSDPTVDTKEDLRVEFSTMTAFHLRKVCRALGIKPMLLPKGKAANIIAILAQPIELAVAAYTTVKLIVANNQKLFKDALRAVFNWVADNWQKLIGIKSWADAVDIAKGEIGSVLN